MVAPLIRLPPELLAVALLYHWYAKVPVPVAVTEMDEKAVFRQVV